MRKVLLVLATLLAVGSIPYAALAGVQITPATLSGDCFREGQAGTFTAVTPTNSPTLVLIDEDTTHAQTVVTGVCTINGVEYPFTATFSGGISYYHFCDTGTFLLWLHPLEMTIDLNGVPTTLVPHQAIEYTFTADDEKERKEVCKSGEKVNKTPNEMTDAQINHNLSALIAAPTLRLSDVSGSSGR